MKEPLSRRERDVARAVGRGLTNRQIAEELGLREQTVKNVVSDIFAKLELHSRVQLALYAAKHDKVLK